MLAPGDCSPSLNVVSKIVILLVGFEGKEFVMNQLLKARMVSGLSELMTIQGSKKFARHAAANLGSSLTCVRLITMSPIETSILYLNS